MDTRPVIVRTDASADDFWSRVRESSEVSPEFKIKRHGGGFSKQHNKNTPFGKQVDPFDMRRPVQGLPPSVCSSRSVERIVLTKAIRQAENDANMGGKAENDNANMGGNPADIIHQLQRENAILRVNLKRVLIVNHALASNMLSVSD